MTRWTFETLATAGRDKLEETLRTSRAPDYGGLEGRLYRGMNLGFVGRLAGEKFKKGFARREARPLGYNELCRQDRKGPDGDWQVKPGRDHVGYFRVTPLPAQPQRRPYAHYPRAGLFDYGLELNTGFQLPFRLIRDVVALPNEDDHDLVLGKAYLDVGLGRIFCCWFVLGYSEPLENGSR
jgi:hypothetical protein